MSLPLLLSMPHAGLKVPTEVAALCILDTGDIVKDGDEHAADIYAPLEEYVAAFVTTDVARAIVDMNRAPDDFRRDGVVKTHTCWDVPVYRTPLPEPAARALIERYHRPWHERLTGLARPPIVMGVDCHTMAAVAPPVAPDPGQERPAVCLSNVMGDCPPGWTADLLECFVRVFAPHRVTLNDPFSGGYITRTHSAELPWVQLELSRAAFQSDAEKSRRVLRALRLWCTVAR